MITRLALPDDQWVDVKDKLKVKDKGDQHAYSVDGVATDGQSFRLNGVRYGIATAAIRIVNWSVRDEFGKPIYWPSGKSFKDRVAIIEGLDEDVFDGIFKAISDHVTAVEEAADAAKKSTPDGVTDSGPSSSSAS